MQDNNKLIAFSELRNEGCGQEIPFLSFFDDQSLTLEEKDNVLKKIGLADEQLNLTIVCEEPSAVMGVVVSITYDDSTQQYTWQGQTISVIIPMFSQYTISFSNVSGYSRPEPLSFTSKKNFVRNVTAIYEIGYTDLSLKGINGEDLGKRNTANCYVIKSTGYYEFPLVYGNAITDDKENNNSYFQVYSEHSQPFYNYLNNQIVSPFIETDTGVEAASGEVVYADVPQSDFTITGIELVQRDLCKYLRFQVNTFPALGGNATLAVKDANNQIMWSWHIWAYADTLTTKAHTNTEGFTYNFLDVNLGWVKDAAGSKYGTCPFYQWGRKDPMLRAADSSSSSNPPVSYGTWRIIEDLATSVAAAIQNPNVFYGINWRWEDYNWWEDNYEQIDFYNYWDASQTIGGSFDKTIAKTIYDPCPAGYCVPCGNAFWGFYNSNGGTWDKGRIWDGRYFPSSGYRYYEQGGIQRNEGMYWTASSVLPDEEDPDSRSGAYCLNFDSRDTYPEDWGFRANGAMICPARIS